MTEKYAIGIDVGGTNTKFGIVDKNGEIFYIDPIVRLNVSGEGYDGKRKFGQIKI